LQFDRRQLVIAEERDDHVVVKTGSSLANMSPLTEASLLPNFMKTNKWSPPGCRSNEQ
jgi:hypothetical protein